MLKLSDQEFADIQSAVSWNTGEELPDGRVLGVAGKRGKLMRGVDSRVKFLSESFPVQHAHVLEIGCCEGLHSVQLAKVAARVTAVDVRPKNVICAMVRAFVHEAKNIDFRILDVRQLGESKERFDAIFHVGVLYHLMNPVQHLFALRQLSDQLLLDTHVCDDDTAFAPMDEVHETTTYRAFAYRGEEGWKDVFSGVEPTSRWLHRNALLNALHDAGFDSLSVVRDRQERNGPRITVVAKATAANKRAA